MNFIKTPKQPYYAVLFTFELTGVDGDEYQETAARLMQMAQKVDGFYGEDSGKTDDGVSITMSYWRDEAAIREWRDDAEHIRIRKIGRQKWYKAFDLRVAKVERDYYFSAPSN